jgi:HD-GYP domain-containing protein (c-di-GMP phosphodiesterase class II)
MAHLMKVNRRTPVRFLRWPPDMTRPLYIAAGSAAGTVIAGALVHRELEARRAAERFVAATLETLLYAIDANDRETGAHARRVARYALVLADAAGFDDEGQRCVERVALFHDIGKIHEALFDLIRDPSDLTPEERRAIATHPSVGARVLGPLKPFDPGLAEGVLSHHERWDGGGYPRRLRGSRIPISARVVAIADTFDAITHRRRYRPERSVEEAAARIAAGRGTQFDPQLTDLFLLPPVFDRVIAEMRAAHAPAVRHRDRRVGEEEPRAPNVTFRWRFGSPARRPPGRRRRTAR